MNEILSQIPVWLTVLMVGATLIRLASSAAGVIIYGQTAPIKKNSTKIAGIWIISAMFIVWGVLVLYLGRRDFFRVDATTVPPPAVAIAALLPILVGVGAFFLWDTFRRIILNIPQHWMIGFQFLRVTGGSFLILYALGLLPGIFAIPAGLGDIATGTLAIPVAYFYYKQKSWSRTVAVVWNYVGLAELLMLVPLGILTSPSQFQQLALHAPNYLTTNWPVVLAPTVMVPSGILMHFYSLAMLKRDRQVPEADSGAGQDYTYKLQEEYHAN